VIKKHTNTTKVCKSKTTVCAFIMQMQFWNHCSVSVDLLKCGNLLLALVKNITNASFEYWQAFLDLLYSFRKRW